MQKKHPVVDLDDNVEESSSKRQRSTTPKSSTIPTLEWPPYFKRLELVHRAVNTISTFLCARKNVAPLFESLKTTVGTQIKRELTLEDGAAIKCLLPQNVRFEYVDESDLQVYEEYVPDRATLGKETANDIFNIPDSDDIEDVTQLLVFEFIEEDLRTTPIRPDDSTKRKPSGRDLIRMPTYSVSNMTKLISKRNAKFAEAVNRFLESCMAKAMDPEIAFQTEIQQHIPVRPSLLENTRVRGLENKAYPSSLPKERKPIPRIIADLTYADDYDGQIVRDGTRIFGAQNAIYGDLDFLISQELADALYTASNVTKFYCHQAQALNDIIHGKHVIIATSTSSGKSLIYQVPILRSLENEREARAIYIFPTKALAQDQKRALQSILGLMDSMRDVVVDTFDGDTPKEDRARIRDNASIIFTNPDMLHLTILPGIEQWRSFFRNLKFVVVDELHVYNGLFGSHIALIMRRLRRLCAWLGNDSVQFISCSATIRNPLEHMSKIFGVQDIKVIDNDGSPAGEKHFLVWNCRHKDRNDPKLGRISAIAESAQLFVKILLNGVRTIAFCRVRSMCELLMRAVRQELANIKREDILDRVMSYRGGYTPQDRRQIEKDMFEGQLLGIISTNALELGVDIGSLDAVILVGFPFSIANLRQQSGRAGRRNKDSLTVLVGDAHPVDQHFMKNPAELFDRPDVDAVLDLENPLILESHLQCAAFELPICLRTDEEYFGQTLRGLVRNRLVKLDQGIEKTDDEMYTCHPRFLPWPSRCVSIRDIEEDMYAVLDITNGRNVVVEEIEATRVPFTLYEGAIFHHQGKPYLVRDFNPDSKIAKIEKTTVDWTTAQRDFTDVDAQEIQAMKAIVPTSATVINSDNHLIQYAYFGTIKITMIVFGYFKKDARGRIIDAVDVSTTPPVVIETQGFWVDVPESAVRLLNYKKLHLAGAIHAAEHAIISMMHVVVMSNAGDIRTECKAPEKEFAGRETARKRPARLIFYDSGGGFVGTDQGKKSARRGEIHGSGMSRKVFEFLEEVVKMAIDRIQDCECEFGCPKCVAAANCKESSIVLSKVGALVVLKSIMDEKIDADSIPEGPEGNLPSQKFVETIVPVAGRVRMASDVEFVGSRTIGDEGSNLFTFKTEPELNR